MSYRKEFLKEDFNKDAFLKEASFVARLGSGSAARSVFPHGALWGKAGMGGEYAGACDEYAIPFKLGPIFKTYCNSIVIVSEKIKKISSSQGHEAMNNHPYREARFQRAHENLKALVKAMECEDLWEFCTLVESEALDLHGLMMSGQGEGVVLLTPETLDIITKIRNFRKKRAFPVCFTLDAGPNVHILYPSSGKKEVRAFIDDIIDGHRDRSVIHDGVGTGPFQDGS